RNVAPGISGSSAGSASDTASSSAATRIASAARGFVTDARWNGSSIGPTDATTPDAPTTAAAADETGHDDAAANAAPYDDVMTTSAREPARTIRAGRRRHRRVARPTQTSAG